MIEINNNILSYSFDNLPPSFNHRMTNLRVQFIRTMQVPMDGNVHILPDSYDRFPLEHIDDFKHTVPENWLKRGGLIMPMYQSEALFIRFACNSFFPIAVKVAVGKINALTGEPWCPELSKEPQDYFVVPETQNLCGYQTEEGVGRQFVAIPIGKGLSPEEQINNSIEYGGIQIVAYPLKKGIIEQIINREEQQRARIKKECPDCPEPKALFRFDKPAMSIALGGKLRQDIYEDERDISDWDMDRGLRCFIQIANGENYENLTGNKPKYLPLSKEDYSKENISPPENTKPKLSLMGSRILNNLKKVME